MTTNLDSNGAEALQNAFQIDENYEFSAPKFFDFIIGESKDEIKKAELWFEMALSHAPSPFMPRIKAGRTAVNLESVCNFSPSKQIQKESHKHPEAPEDPAPDVAKESHTHPEAPEDPAPDVVKESHTHPEAPEDPAPDVVKESQTHPEAPEDPAPDVVSANASTGSSSVAAPNECNDNKEAHLDENCVVSHISVASSCKDAGEACTPKAQMISAKGSTRPPTSSKHQTGLKKLANPSVSRSKNQKQSLGVKSSNVSAKKNMGLTDFAQTNQAIKKQKLEGGKSRPILDIKNRVLPHKSKPSSAVGDDISESVLKGGTEERSGILSRRKVYVREPFVSMAEMVKKFQSKTRELGLSHDDASSMMQGKQRLTLTRPQEPQFETALRARPVKKNPGSAFIADSSRSTPQRPDFQEFHLKTMERAHQHSSVASSTDSSSCQNNANQGKVPKLTEARTPRLETALRSRPTKVKNSQELEQEELEKMPKFKARRLNRKIFESRGEIGVFCNQKRQLTVPQGFHFATDERIPPPPAKEVFHIFDKLSLNSEPSREKPLPRITTPNPFHLHTEERGQEKEKKFAEELMRKEWEEERARIPKAKPYPYTTDFPVIPPKPEPKEWTKPEAFQLESLVRHEEEMQRKMAEKERMEREEAKMRLFRAQPILKDDPIPLPEKTRIPLTQVQEFQLQVDSRAVDREEFDKKIKEKETMYKRLREEYESAKMEEEEKVVKQMRRTMVPHARPLPSFDNPFIPQKSNKETTKAISPNLLVIKRNERRVASASAAAHMR
ncbi:protein TPX2 [Cinnamomum micranthum f. kanehirae]|uniref:Protein TPX2 n=1 Tax=Cinnamomum micranthum f. kanehirae TaxID=337451 RepID=A0A443NMP7_9MAGN|nr:protein TPX2 [Cinnamomum micranthum f. kanehirae]